MYKGAKGRKRVAAGGEPLSGGDTPRGVVVLQRKEWKEREREEVGPRGAARDHTRRSTRLRLGYIA